MTKNIEVQMDMQLDGDGAAYIIESMEAVSEVAECTCKCIVDAFSKLSGNMDTLAAGVEALSISLWNATSAMGGRVRSVTALWQLNSGWQQRVSA